MKKSTAAVVLLLAFGGAAYWLQGNGQLKSFWPGASVTQVQPAAPAGSGVKCPPSSVEVATAKEGQLSDDIAAIGSLVSEESVDIAAETNGRIVEILFADGTQVNAGDVL
ncbi:MAG: hypothetical protein WBB16_03325, partial [Aestuariivirga sp.]